MRSASALRDATRSPPTSPRSPTTSTPARTPSSCTRRSRDHQRRAPRRPSASSGSRPAAARIPRSARTPRSTSPPSTRCVGRFPDLDLILIESGGDNLSATFSPELADITLYVIDVSAGDKIPRKGGPGITRSDLLVINKTDLAPHVGASLEVMDRDARAMRGDRPFQFAQVRNGLGLPEIIAFIETAGGLPATGRETVSETGGA
jgi:hypothetical protein